MTYTSDEKPDGLTLATTAESDDVLVGQKAGETDAKGFTVQVLAEGIADVGIGARVVTVASGDLTANGSHSGAYVRMTDGSAKSLFVEDDATYGTDLPGDHFEVNVRCQGGDLTIGGTSTDVVINLPAGGTYVLEEGMTVTLKRVAANEYDLIGQTVPA